MRRIENSEQGQRKSSQSGQSESNDVHVAKSPSFSSDLMFGIIIFELGITLRFLTAMAFFVR